MQMMTGAKAVVEVLKEEEIRQVFHLPGSQIIDILDELFQSPIRPIMTRHEQGAAFMADGYARATRSAGVCMSTVGPGAVNLVSGIASSYKANIPVLAITGLHQQSMLERNGFHEIDQAALFRPITKWSATVHLPEKIPEMLRKAFRVMLAGRKGPVHLAIPTDVSRGTTNFDPRSPQSYRTLAAPTVPKEVLDEILRRVSLAKRPLILVGNEILWSPVTGDLAALAEALGAPVATTRDASGAFPKSYPLGLGLIGKGRGEAANEAIKNADLILALGAKFDYQSTRYNNDLIPKGVELIQVSIDPEEVGLIYPLALGVVADAGMVIKGLLGRIGTLAPNAEARANALTLKEKAAAKLEAEADYTATPLQPQAAVRTLRRILPRDTIIVVDGGNFAKHVRRHFDLFEPDTFHYPEEFGSVGASYPMALGIKAANPHRPVVCLTGDGGFLLNSQELETAVREKIDVITVVFNDYGFGNIRAYQEKQFDGRYMCDYANPPFDRFAQLFNAHGARADSVESLQTEVLKALGAGKPSVIDLIISRASLETPGFLA